MSYLFVEMKALKKKVKGGKKQKVTKNSKKNSDDEAVEESDEGDYDDREVRQINKPKIVFVSSTDSQNILVEFVFLS